VGSNNGACGGWLYGPRLGAILVQREMRAASVVIVKICRQHTAQVPLIEDDDVIETFAADRADDAFDIGVLPGRSRRSETSSIAIAWTRSRNDRPYDASRSRSRKRGAVSQGKASMIWRASQPCVGFRVISKWMTPSLMAEDDQSIKQLKLRRYNKKQVDGGGVMQVIVQERAPGRGGDLGPPWQVSANRGLAHVDAELQQLAWMRGAPQSGFAWLNLAN
jgi:hypothetical protein